MSCSREWYNYCWTDSVRTYVWVSCQSVLICCLSFYLFTCDLSITKSRWQPGTCLLAWSPYHVGYASRTIVNRGDYCSNNNNKFLFIQTLKLGSILIFPYVIVTASIPWKSSSSYTITVLIFKPTSSSNLFHCFSVRSRLPHELNMIKSNAVEKGGHPVSGRIMSFMSSTECGVMAVLMCPRMVFALSSLQLCRIQPKW